MKELPFHWDQRFLKLANQIGGWSKDPGHKVGAVIVRPDRTVASVGYNGFPRGVKDTYGDRDVKLMKTVHAEMNAILSAREPLHGYRLYVSPLFPCANCAAGIIQSGIGMVVCVMPEVTPEQWKASFDVAQGMFAEANVLTSAYTSEVLNV
ncbi:ComEB Deoxycytidylate deaminase [uncultured Caudovirales phage]|uniref:ComEB Deoxycytidylate deaminase n=1 Tax=uncultured Caudovirales phage TaxID=2100421 RepID=A0A6J7WQX2_9CAUD|nr:ComEB Deoxycytidylate deaminase [uncultured Caudovirales phage]